MWALREIPLLFCVKIMILYFRDWAVQARLSQSRSLASHSLSSTVSKSKLSASLKRCK